MIVIITYYTLNFNPRSPRGERPQCNVLSLLFCNISIHALREESDSSKLDNEPCGVSISIHALREESDMRYFFDKGCFRFKFQSTLSARRATVRQPIRVWRHNNFNPRSPRGERLYHKLFIKHKSDISIHALREESDSTFWAKSQ